MPLYVVEENVARPERLPEYNPVFSFPWLKDGEIVDTGDDIVLLEYKDKEYIIFHKDYKQGIYCDRGGNNIWVHSADVDRTPPLSPPSEAVVVEVEEDSSQPPVENSPPSSPIIRRRKRPAINRSSRKTDVERTADEDDDPNSDYFLFDLCVQSNTGFEWIGNNYVPRLPDKFKSHFTDIGIPRATFDKYEVAMKKSKKRIDPRKQYPLKMISDEAYKIHEKELIEIYNGGDTDKLLNYIWSKLKTDTLDLQKYITECNITEAKYEGKYNEFIKIYKVNSICYIAQYKDIFIQFTSLDEDTLDETIQTDVLQTNVLWTKISGFSMYNEKTPNTIKIGRSYKLRLEENIYEQIFSVLERIAPTE